MANAIPTVEGWLQERWPIEREPRDIGSEDDEDGYEDYVVDVKDLVAKRIIRER